jgi:hypothetical protein
MHGSVSDGSIIPPTFNKGLYLKKVPPAWGDAYDVLRNAHENRIIGYSLPQSDTYIKYILKAARATTKVLEHIDVVCFDPDPHEEVKKRYDEFILFRYYKFCNRKTEDYLEKVNESRQILTDHLGQDIVHRVEFNHLESAHEKFCAANGVR